MQIELINSARLKVNTPRYNSLLYLCYHLYNINEDELLVPDIFVAKVYKSEQSLPDILFGILFMNWEKQALFSIIIGVKSITVIYIIMV